MLILNNLQPVLELTPVADASGPAWVGVPVPGAMGWLSPRLHLCGERGQKWGGTSAFRTTNLQTAISQEHVPMAISTGDSWGSLPYL